MDDPVFDVELLRCAESLSASAAHFHRRPQSHDGDRGQVKALGEIGRLNNAVRILREPEEWIATGAIAMLVAGTFKCDHEPHHDTRQTGAGSDDIAGAEMDLGLSGASVLVTGGSRGIGACIARAYAAEGANVAITYAVQRDAARRVVEQLRAVGVEAFATRLDLTDSGSVAAAVDAVLKRFGALDVLVTNAVRWEEWRNRVEDWILEDWQPVLRANMEGVFVLAQRAAPALRRSGRGRLVFVSSSLAERGMVGTWSYATAKAGGHGLARSLAWDLGRDGVLVNTVMPGTVLVDGHHRSVPDGELPALAAAQPIGRLPTGDDVARAVLFLGSSANGSISGEIVRVTGGVS
jgi:NAD(P)-dependent dehydrogenase (short-subunit alcohol dehydrogenase family)